MCVYLGGKLNEGSFWRGQLSVTEALLKAPKRKTKQSGVSPSRTHHKGNAENHPLVVRILNKVLGVSVKDMEIMVAFWMCSESSIICHFECSLDSGRVKQFQVCSPRVTLLHELSEILHKRFIQLFSKFNEHRSPGDLR